MKGSVSADFARFCAQLNGEQLSATVKERVRYLLLNHLAVTLRGSVWPSTAVVYRALDTMVPVDTREGATIIGRQERADASLAALVNGVAAHSLGMDDVENRSSLHPGCVVFPAVLALAEQQDASVEDFYAAVIAGYEATLRLGASLNPVILYERGFHPTAICGALGSAIACARLLNLSAEQANMAMGIAGSMAAGSMAYQDEGAWTKQLHPGWACHSGVMAARLAASGFVGPRAILESPHGFFHAYSPESSLDSLSSSLSNEPSIMQVSLKPYACCRYMHGTIDCLIEIVNEHHPEPEQIASVHCGVLTVGWPLVVNPIEHKRNVQNVVESQSSMPYAASIALLTGQAGISVFDESWLYNPRVRALMQRIECYTSSDFDAFYPTEWRAAASVRMQDGREYHSTNRYALGDPHKPLSWEQMEERFHELVAPVIQDRPRRREIIERVKKLEDIRLFY